MQVRSVTWKSLAVVLWSISCPIAHAGPVFGEEGMQRKLKRERGGPWDLKQQRTCSFI